MKLISLSFPLYKYNIDCSNVIGINPTTLYWSTEDIRLDVEKRKKSGLIRSYFFMRWSDIWEIYSNSLIVWLSMKYTLSILSEIQESYHSNDKQLLLLRFHFLVTSVCQIKMTSGLLLIVKYHKEVILWRLDSNILYFISRILKSMPTADYW